MSTDTTARDALLREARELRVRHRLPEALAALVRLQQAHPRFSRLYQERGHCHVLLRDAPAAVTALREAVRLNPTLPASWDMLQQLHAMLGEASLAAAAAQHLAALKQLPPDLVMANSLYTDGDLAPAEEVIRAYLRRDGGNVGALRLLARIRRDCAAHDEAEAILAALLARAPDYHAARLDYAMALLEQQKHLPARAEAARLLGHDPDNRDYLKQYAAASIGLGDYEPVVDVYDRLLASPSISAAEIADLRLWRANALKVTGRQAEAIADYRASLAARPDNGVAWFSLANLKTYRFSDDEMARLRASASRNAVQDMDRVYLSFALGKALEDKGDYAASWRSYEHGNDIQATSSPYRPEATEACAARLRQVFTADFFAVRAGWGAPDPAPIFVLGLPRSGSTLIEQILASHSLVEGTQELTEIDRYVVELCGRDPACGLPLDLEPLQRLAASEARALGERFLNETRAYRRLGRPFFIDKAPNNFWRIGLIHLILPRSTIIDVRREPMACCFSNLKQLFGAANQPFAYGAERIGRYYRAYLDMMRHWSTALPGRVLTVQYEDVVDDLEGGVRRMLAHAGLSFEPACLAFHETQRSVRTPSSEQVRRPIGREGLDRWRNYAPWLGELETVLGDARARYRA